ncbi:PFU-domain-containing protein [Auriscalpium vulgare]|uniref:PFU-domain-containing protein n=1 Tax=Auriscalpium vulgare TaxID=40419 RepID=A0ACB8SBN2_9AGAM|nr:PFU-domain-containing protein [Auriscalpium vulgare]
MPFKLAASLAAHSADVRAVASPTDTLILSASRDSTAISWAKPSDASFSPAAIFTAGYAVTGGQDAIINVWTLGSPASDPTYSLLGHLDNVCSLHAKPDGTIISGSWDKTAKIWQGFQLQHDLTGHTQSVWTVTATEGEEYLTGSADKTIKLWRQNKCLRTYHGHKDAVRSLATLTDVGFASASNDSEIIIWTFEGDVVHSLSAHTSFVYSLSILPSGDIVSGGEDRTVRVWRDGECAQTIVHPAISVWAVSSMPNGDIVTGASDGVVRVFSEAEERWASPEELKAFDDQVASQALPSQQVGDVNKSDLSGIEALANPGKFRSKPDEVKMVRNGAIVEAHQWDAAAGRWMKIGEVVDAVGSGRRQLHEGKEYDYVFDVDIQDGVPPLKLPYNANENPYAAAQRFLERNELPMTYIDQVVQFIEKNTAGVKLGGSDEFVDPYTGASRYRSAGAPAQAAASSYSDPYTGSSRYVSTAPTTPLASAVASSDPFTGAGRYVPGGVASKAVSKAPAVIPVYKTVPFKQANVNAMQGKLYQFDQALRSEISTSALAMYPDEVGQLEEAFSFLSQSITGGRPSASLTPAHIETVVNILDRWPASQRFPVLDLARLLSGFCSDLIESAGYRTNFFEALYKASELNNDGSPSTKAKETNILLALRTIVNAFQEKTKLGDGAWAKKILVVLDDAPYDAYTKAQRVALSTVLFNLSCIALQERVEPSLRSLHVRFLEKVLRTERGDPEVVYRALVGLGNVLYAAKSQGYPLDATQLNSIKDCITPLPSAVTDARITGVVGEIFALI